MKLNIWDTSLQITCLMTIICIDSAIVYIQANMLVRKLFGCCKDYSLESQAHPYAYSLLLGEVQEIVLSQTSDCTQWLLEYTDLKKKARWSRASDLFCKAGVGTLQVLWEKVMYKFVVWMCLKMILSSSLLQLSQIPITYSMWRSWYKCLL